MIARRNRRAWLFAAGSAAIHVAVILLLSRARFETPLPRATEIELSIISEPAKREPVPAQVAAIEPAPSEPIAPALPATPLQPKKKRATDTPAQATPPEPSPRDPQASEVAIETPSEQSADSQPSAAPRPTWVPKKFNLSAQRAASSMIDNLEMPPRQCNPRASSSDPAACPPAERAARIERELNLGLSQAANAPAYRQKREPPELHRQGDGSYRYDGKVFAAKIRDDGHVEFYDGSSVGVDGPAKTGPGIAGHLDLNDLADSAMGKELYTAEKRWFLEQTVELRDKLAATARNRENLQARRMLEAELERILVADEAATRKRQRILALWEDCGDDAESADTRRIVELFVRTKMPEGSELGFSREELERFNRGRSGIRAFNPYRG